MILRWYAARRRPRVRVAARVGLAVLALASATGAALAACGPAPSGTTVGPVSGDLARIISEARKVRSVYCGPGPGRVDTRAPSPTDAPRTQANPGPRRPREVVARIDGDSQTVTAVARANNLVVLETRRIDVLDAQSARFQIPDARTIDAVIAQLANDVRVVSSDANHLFRLQADSLDDARFAPKLIKLAAPAAVGLTGTGTRIAIIDTAVDDKNPPLAGRIAGTFNSLPDVPINSRRHGTVVSSLIAGGDGFRGIASRAQLYVARAFDLNPDGEGITDYFAIEASINWAAGLRVRILNMSFAGPYNRNMEAVLKRVSTQGMLLVASVGNEGPDAPPAYPAAFDSVIAVTAIDERRQVYQKANRGRHVFIAAPGVDILAATPGGAVDFVGGTSFATPFVSGIAALILERQPSASPRSIAVRLSTATVDLGDPDRDPVFGHGLVDMSLLFGR